MIQGVRIPLDLVVESFGKEIGFEEIITLHREIPYKAMPTKNSPSNEKGATSETMSKESIVVMKKL